jgi:hypothetical protein
VQTIREVEPGILEHGPFQNSPQARGGYFSFGARELYWYEQVKGVQLGLTRAEALMIARNSCRRNQGDRT